MTVNSSHLVSRGAALLCGVILLTALGALRAHAQRFEYTYGGVQCVEAGRGGVLHSINGGYLAVGESFTPGLCGPSDIYVVRTDNLGGHMWEYTYDIGGNDSATSVLECPNGDFVIVGVTSNALPSACVPSRDAFLMRIDRCGIVLWTTTYGAAASDEIGWDVIAATTGDPNFGTAPGDFLVAGSTTNATAPGTRDGWIFRVNAAGGMIWGQQYDVAFRNRDDYYYSLIEAVNSASPAGTPTKDIVAVGGTTYNGSVDALMVRVNGNNGTIGAAPQGTAAYGTAAGTEDLRSVRELSIGVEAGNLVATGRTNATSPNMEVYLLKTTSNPCTFLGDRTLGDLGANPDEGYCIREITLAGQPGLNLGNLIVTGYVTTLPALGGFGGQDVFLQEYTPLLVPVAPVTRIFGGTGTDWGWSVAVLGNEGNCQTSGYIVAGFTTSCLNAPCPADPQQMYLIKTDAAKSSNCNDRTYAENDRRPNLPRACLTMRVGPFSPSCQPGVTAICRNWPRKLCVTNDGMFACPAIACPVCVPPLKGHADEVISGSMVELDGASALTAYPNPVGRGSTVNLAYTLAEEGKASVMITDIAGKIIYTHTALKPAGRISLPVSTEGWASGAYLIKLEAGGRSITRRLVVIDR